MTDNSEECLFDRVSNLEKNQEKIDWIINQLMQIQDRIDDVPDKFDPCMERLNEAIELSEENMKRLQLMMNEFKGVVAMSRASLKIQKTNEEECNHGKCCC